MLTQLSDLISRVAGIAAPGRLAFVLAALLAAAGIVLVWPRRRMVVGSPIEAATPPDAVAMETCARTGQWQRLSGVIEAGACRADDAGRAHSAAGNAIEALEHDIGTLLAELAVIGGSRLPTSPVSRPIGAAAVAGPRAAA